MSPWFDLFTREVFIVPYVDFADCISFLCEVVALELDIEGLPGLTVEEFCLSEAELSL